MLGQMPKNFGFKAKKFLRFAFRPGLDELDLTSSRIVNITGNAPYFFLLTVTVLDF